MIYAKPGMNGNTEDDFVAAHAALHITEKALRIAIERLLVDVFHGRNYQHLAFSKHARDRDMLRLAKHARDRDMLRLERLNAFLVELETMQRDVIAATGEVKFPPSLSGVDAPVIKEQETPQ